MNFCLFHSRVEAGSLCGMSRQEGLRLYRPLMDCEFGTHQELLFALWLGLPGWMRSVEMDQHSPSPCGPESACRLPERSNSGGKGARWYLQEVLHPGICASAYTWMRAQTREPLSV